MKKTILFIGVICITITSLVVSLLFINAKIGEDRFDNGINQIKIVESKSGRKSLKIDLGNKASGSYSARLMDEDEMIYVGENLVKDDGSLGKYRIEIMFYDIQGSEALTNEYSIGKVHELKDVPTDLKSNYKIRIAYPPNDCAFVVYIGSDEPIKINEQKNMTRINGSKSNIELALEK